MARSRIVNLANFEQFTAINVLSDPGHIGGPVIVPNCAQVILNWTLSDGKAAHCVLYGRYAGTFNGTPAMAQALFAAMTTGAAWTAIAQFIAPTTSFAGVSLRDMNTPNNPLINSTGAAVPGTGTGTPLPNEVAIAVTLRTAKAGVANRGRFFVPGWLSSTVDVGNVIFATTVANLTTWASGFTAILAGQGLTWVIGQPARAAYTGSTGTQHPARAATSIPVTQALVRDNHFDSQRRRGLK